MGLLDSLLSGSQGGYGGLLDSLMYPSPLLKKDDFQQPQYDQMGNPIGGAPQAAADPFGAPPQLNQWAQQFAPPSPFTGTAPSAPIQFAGAAPQPQAPAMPPAQNVAPAPQVAPPQNTANIGGYQMPQIGNPSDFTPAPQTAQAAPSSTDLSAQSRQPQAPMDLPPALGGGMSIGRMFNPDGLIARLTGNDTRSLSQQNLRAQFGAIQQALIANGDSPQQASSKAMVAVMNPEAAKTILPELFTSKEKAQKLTDSFGNERIVFANEREGTTHEANSTSGSSSVSAAPAGDFGSIADSIAKARAAGGSRAQLLQQIPPEYRGYVDAVLQDKALPTNMGRGKARMAILGLAHEVDPSFNEEMIPTRIQMRKDFAGEGKNGQAIGSFNTVQHHAGQVSDAIDQFEKAGGGSDYPLWNAGKLLLANNTGMNPQLRDAAQRLQDKLNATEHEVASAYNSGHVTDADRKTWNEIKASNLPANQLKQKLADFVELLNGKRESLNHMYQQTFHEDAPTIDRAANEAVTSKILQRAPKYDNGGASSGALPSGWSVKVR